MFFLATLRVLCTHAHIQEIITNPDERLRWLSIHRQTLLNEALFRAVHDLTDDARNLSEHLGALGVKRFRIATRFVAVGDPWRPLRVQSEHNIAIAKAGGAIEAGSLILYTDPAEFHLWDGLLNLHDEQFARATDDFQQALEAAMKVADGTKINAALNNLGLVLMQQKKWEEALQILVGVIDDGLETYTPYTNVITCLMELGRLEQAGEYVAKVLARFPEAEHSDVISRFRSGWSGSAA